MKSLQQYISEQMVCELSSTKLVNNPSTYKIGDLYYEGNKAVGIVVDIKDGGKQATVMSLTSFDKNGNHKTSEQDLIWDEAIEGAKKYGNGWHLPSREELKAMSESFDDIQDVLKNTKGALALADNYFYWSSTEDYRHDVYVFDTYKGDVDYTVNKGDNSYVRAFLQV